MQHKKTITKYHVDMKTTTEVELQSFGKGSRNCRACYGHNGLIRKFDLKLCRKCFREYAPIIGFKVYD